MTRSLRRGSARCPGPPAKALKLAAPFSLSPFWSDSRLFPLLLNVFFFGVTLSKSYFCPRGLQYYVAAAQLASLPQPLLTIMFLCFSPRSQWSYCTTIWFGTVTATPLPCILTVLPVFRVRLLQAVHQRQQGRARHRVFVWGHGQDLPGGQEPQDLPLAQQERQVVRLPGKEAEAVGGLVLCISQPVQTENVWSAMRLEPAPACPAYEIVAPTC